MIDRHAILATLNSLLGIRFQHGGRRHETGLDCLGVLMFVAREHGISLEDQQGYAASTDGVELTMQCQAQLIEIPLHEAAPADVVQWTEWSSANAPPCNLAFLGWKRERLTMIHPLTHPGYGYVCEHYLAHQWRDALRHAYRLPGVGPWAPVVEA